MHSRSRLRLLSLLVPACLLLLSTGPLAAAPDRAPLRANGSITVFAAASLTEAFTAIGTAFERATHANVHFSFGGSDTLATQIAQGAPADVFASANQAQMNLVAGKGLIVGTPTVFVRNRLVVIVPRNNPAHVVNLADLGNPGVNLVLAAPGVPVGKYARAAFAVMATDAAFGQDFLKRITANTKSDETDVKAVAAKVSLGEADAGVVYVTDVTPQVAAKVRQIPIPAPFNQVAAYPIAVTKNAQNAALARRFVDYVLSSAGKSALAHRGFITSSPAGGYAASVAISGLVRSPATFTVADLRRLPAVTRTVPIRTDTTKAGAPVSYTGPTLYAVLQQAGLVPNASFKNDLLRQFVTIVGSDTYQVTVALAEILPTFGNQQVLLAYEKDARPLGSDEGAVRLIVPGDRLAGRDVQHVTQVIVGSPVGTP